MIRTSRNPWDANAYAVKCNLQDGRSDLTKMHGLDTSEEISSLTTRSDISRTFSFSWQALENMSEKTRKAKAHGVSGRTWVTQVQK